METASGFKSHAICCIKRALIDCLDKSPHYQVFCNEQDCWKDTDVIQGRLSAVNIMERGDVAGEEVQVKCDGEMVCGTENTLSIEIQVYTKGCDDEKDCLALSILGHVQSQLYQKTHQYFAKRFRYRSMSRQQSDEYAEEFTQITGFYTLEYNFVAEKPSKVFKYGK